MQVFTGSSLFFTARPVLSALQDDEAVKDIHEDGRRTSAIPRLRHGCFHGDGAPGDCSQGAYGDDAGRLARTYLRLLIDRSDSHGGGER